MSDAVLTAKSEMCVLMRKIKLTQNKYAVVDDKDYKQLNRHKWHTQYNGYTYYATRSVYLGSGRKNQRIKFIYMHREILGLKCGDGKQTDHINHNGLDNRRCNIRVVTNQQNQFNCKNVKGYTWHEKAKKWQAQIEFNSRYYYLGLFANKKDARQAYLKAKEELLREK